MFKSKNKKAIKNLHKLQEDIENIENIRQGNNWKSKFKDMLDLYIGKNSSISNRLDNLYFSKKESAYDRDLGLVEKNVFDKNKKQDFLNLIQNSIDFIESNGTLKNSNGENFLSNFTNKEIVGGVVTGITIVLTLGGYLGTLSKDRELLKAEKDLFEIEKQYNDCKKENKDLKLLKRNK